jgi:hypothetical protein
MAVICLIGISGSFGARTVGLGPTSKATFHFGTTFNAGSDQAAPSRDYTTGGEYQQRVGRGDTLSLSLGVNFSSDSETSDYKAVQTRAGYQFGRTVLGTALSLSQTLEAVEYPVSGFTAKGRQDFSATGGANIVFQTIEY